MNASHVQPLPYLLGGYVEPSWNDRPAYVQPFGLGRCALTTGRRIGDRVAFDTSDRLQAH